MAGTAWLLTGASQLLRSEWALGALSTITGAIFLTIGIRLLKTAEDGK